MLASGAHVKIGTYEFLLDESVDAGTAVGNLYRPHYKFTRASLGIGSQQIKGSQKENLRPNRMVWYMDDWSGGEGQRNFDENDPTQYSSGLQVNPRIAGQITGPPSRKLDASSLTANDLSRRCFLTQAAGTVWYGGGYRVGYVTDFSTNPWTWQVINSTGVLATDFAGLQHTSANMHITAMAGDSKYAYYAGWDVADGVALNAKLKDNATVPVAMYGPVVEPPFAGLATMGPRLYAWTGRKLWGFDVSGGVTAAMTPVLKDATGEAIGSGQVVGTDWFGGMVAAESSVFYFYSDKGKGNVYEFSEKRGAAPVWNAPLGLTIRDITYNNGVVYIIAHWGDTGSATGRSEVWAIPLDTRRPVPIHTFRQWESAKWSTTQNGTGVTSTIDALSASYNDQVLFGVRDTGNTTSSIGIYDANFDAVSTLDDISASGAVTDSITFSSTYAITDTLTYGDKRLAVLNTSSGGAGTYQLLAYKTDQPSDAQTSSATGNFSAAYVRSPSWDFDLPFEQKVLMGWDITFSPLTAGQSLIVLAYADDATTPLVTSTTLNFSHADAQKGRTFLTASDATNTYKFTKLRVVVKLIGTRTAAVDYAPPVVYGLATEAATIQYENTWELIVRLKNPMHHVNHKTAAGMVNADTQRTYLRTIVENRNIVSFRDGYRYGGKGLYSTHTVTLEDPEDIIINNAEGSMRLVLREVPR